MSRSLLRLARPAGPALGLSVLAGVASAASAIGLTAAASWLIVRADEHPPVLYLTVAIVCVRAFGLARGVFRYADRLAGHDAALRVVGTLRSQVYTGLTRIAPARWRERRSGDVAASVLSDVDTAAFAVVRVIAPYCVALMVAVASVALAWLVLPAAALALGVGLLIAYLGAPAIQSVVARRAQERTAAVRGELSAHIVELVHGCADLIAYDAVRAKLAAATHADGQLRRASTRSSASVGLGGSLIVGVAGGSAVVCLVAGIAAARGGGLSPVMLGVIALTPLAIFDALAFLPTAAADRGAASAATARVYDIIDQPSPVPDPAAPAPLPAPPYHLRIRSASARWRPAGPDVVRDVNLDLPAGARVALLGPTGSGKTTVAALLVRFLDPSRGQVLLNGVDLRTLPADALRGVVTFVAHDAHIFDSTIADNLRIGRPGATDEQLWAALRAVRLAEWVATLPLGPATPVGERGERLSGGQRRRLVLARALVADRPVLILDEPTEHLDSATAAAVTADLLDATRGRTVLLITHQDYGLDQVDQIVRLATTTVGSPGRAAAP